MTLPLLLTVVTPGQPHAALLVAGFCVCALGGAGHE